MKRRWLCALACAAFFPEAAGAQKPALANGTYRQCFDAARVGDLRRVPGFIATDAADSARELIKPAELLLEIVGERVRASLGAKPGELPLGEPTFTKDNTAGDVRVTLFRDGRMNVNVVSDSATADSTRLAGVRVLAKILRQAWDEGERVFWPEKAKRDSAVFRMFFWGGLPGKDGSPAKLVGRYAVAVFSVALPWVQPATVDDLPNPVYPDGPRSHNVQGKITMSFVVDTTGYALISTMHDVLPPGAPTPVGEMADYYRDFVRAVAEAMPRGRFHAAALAGCRFPQRVELPFDFKLNSVR